MGLLDAFRQNRAEREYLQKVEAWLLEDKHNSDSLLRLLAAKDGQIPAGITLGSGERYVGQLPAGLVMSKTKYVRNTVGGSTKVGDRSRAFGSHSVTNSVEENKVVDTGVVHWTDRRAVFLGRMKSIEWPFSRALSFDINPGMITIHISGRQRSYGFTVGSRTAGEAALDLLTLSTSLHDGAEDGLANQYLERYDKHIASPPIPPPGVAPDARVADVLARATKTARGATAVDPIDTRKAPAALVPVVPEAPPATYSAVGGRLTAFAHIPAENVVQAARVIQETPVLVSAAQIPSLNQDVPPVDGPWTLIVDGDVAGLDPGKTLFTGATHISVCASEATLSEIGIRPLDSEWVIPDQVAYTTKDTLAVEAELKGEGYLPLTSAVSDDPTELDIAWIDAIGLLMKQRISYARSLGLTSQDVPRFAWIVPGTPAGQAKLSGRTRAVDRLVFLGEQTALADLGVAAIDAPPQPWSEEPEDTLPALPEAPPITVAGRQVVRPGDGILSYLVNHAGTVSHYDLVAGTFETVTPDLIAATRRPWMNSRISKEEEAWFIERAATAPWHLVPRGSKIAEADPTVHGGLYERATELWAHFRSAAPKRVAGAKISKVLYLMRPEMFPILDSRLTKLYEAVARTAASDVRAVRPDVVGNSKWLYWEAIRRDVLAAAPALAVIRSRIAEADVPGASDVITQISDLRLLDMLAWAGAPEDDEDSGDD